VDRGDSHGEAEILAEQATVAEAAPGRYPCLHALSNPSFPPGAGPQVTPRIDLRLQN